MTSYKIKPIKFHVSYGAYASAWWLQATHRVVHWGQHKISRPGGVSVLLFLAVTLPNEAYLR